MAEISWGILLAGYLFVGGLAGGAYMIAAIADLLGKGRYKVLSKSGTYVSLVSIMVGLVLLVLDLGRFEVDLLSPLNAYINFPTSIMSVGTWIVTAFMVVSLMTAILWFFKGNNIVRKLIEIVGIVLGGSTAAYTGLLLAFARGRPLWASPFLPWTFVVSGTLTGLVMAWLLIPIIAWFMPRFFEDFRELLDKRTKFATLLSESQQYITILIFIELALVVIELATGFPHSTILLTGERLSMIFYTYVILGLLAPLGIAYYIGKLTPNRNEISIISSSIGGFVLVLIGGFLLRYAILTAGQIII